MNSDSEQSNLLPEEKYSPLTPLESYRTNCTDLCKSPRDLWLIYIIKFCVTASQSTFFLVLAIYIIEVKSLPDLAITVAYGLIGVASIIFHILFGSLPDKLGYKTPLIIGGFSMLLNTLIFTCTTNNVVQLLSAVLLFTFGMTLTHISLDLGIKYYTHAHYRSLAVSFYFGIIYLSIIVGGVIIEVILNSGGKNESNFRIIFILCTVLLFIGIALSFFLRTLDYSMYENKELTRKVGKENWWQHMRQVLVLKKFWRIFALVIVLIFIKVIFYQQMIMLPIYMDRDLGDDSHYGVMVILNQVIIIVTLPLFAYLNYYANIYDIFIYGGIVAVLSLVPFLFGASYFTVVSYIVISSLAESLYGPKVLEHILNISPKGKEGLFVALISIPSNLSAIFSGVLGGVLLEEYCPEDGERKCWLMWFIVGAIAAFFVLILIFFRKWIEEPRFESQPYMSCTKESNSN